MIVFRPLSTSHHLRIRDRLRDVAGPSNYLPLNNSVAGGKKKKVVLELRVLQRR